MIISRGDPTIFVNFAERPISATLLVLSALALVIVFLPNIASKRKAVFEEPDEA
jgi:putative tricarboxylic transport membrane protein